MEKKLTTSHGSGGAVNDEPAERKFPHKKPRKLIPGSILGMLLAVQGLWLVWMFFVIMSAGMANYGESGRSYSSEFPSTPFVCGWLGAAIGVYLTFDFLRFAFSGGPLDSRGLAYFLRSIVGIGEVLLFILLSLICAGNIFKHG